MALDVSRDFIKKIESIMQVSTSCVTARQSFWQLSRPTRMITRITYSNHL